MRIKDAGFTPYAFNPVYIIGIPLNCLAERVLEMILRFPPQLFADERGIDGIAAVVSRSVFHELERPFVFAEVFEDQGGDFAVVHFVVRADIVDGPRPASQKAKL